MMLLATLLAVTSSLTLILAYKVRRLQKERDRLLHEKRKDSKILFLKSRYASMGETVGNIAHQWKQPLNAIGTIQNSIKASLIFQGEVSKEKLLYSVETSFKLLRHLAETIDTFYSFLAQKGDEKTSFELAGEMEKVRKITEYSFENSRIALNFEFETNPTIQGNASEFTHAMLNLILNAKDAFDGVCVHAPVINVNISGGKENCRITVADNAGGIRLNPAEMVFDLHITTKENGSGLGLFMTKNIIENRFGGSISVENKNGGACFTITLPYAEYGEHYADTPLPDEKGTLERINQLSHKIIELEEVEKALKKWADSFEQAQWGIVMCGAETMTLDLMNPAFAQMHGFEVNELTGKPIESIFAPECRDHIRCILNTVHKESHYAFESVHIRKDGSQFPVAIDITAVKDESGNILYRIANVRDITTHKEAQERLLLKKFALDHIKDAVFLIDENANFQYVNEGACKTLGYSFEEFEQMNVGDIDPDWPRERWSEHCKTLKEVRSMTMELRHRHKNGTILPVEVSANCIEFGGKAYNMAIARDITERKAAEKELLLLNKALNNTSEAAYILMNERIIQVNDGACRMLGYTREELSSMTLFDFDKEAKIEELESTRNSAMKLNSSVRFERKHTTKEGEILHVEIDTSLFEYDGITYSFAIVRDITEQKKGQEELLLKEFALNTVNEAVFLIDKDSMFHYVNEAACTTLGYTKDELVFMGVTDLDPNFPIEQWRSHWEDIKEQKTTLTLTHHRRKDGTLFPIEISSNYFEYNGIGYSLAVSRDITERLQLEEQKDNERMRLFFERQLVGMAITSPEYGWMHTNEKLQKMLGYSHDELYTLTWVEMTHPDDLAADMEQFDKLLRGEIEDYMLEKRFIRKDGSIVYTNLAVSCVRNDDRSVNYVLALLEDITERKAAEKELLEKTDELKKALEFNEGIIGAIPDLLFEIAPDGTYVGVWAQDEALLAAQKEILLGKKFQEILPPNAAVMSFQAMKEVDEKGVSLGKTYCLDLPEGKRWFELSVSKKKMSGNYIALSRDITERKIIEEQLTQSETGLKEAQKIAKIGSWELELPSQELRWSDETYRIFEISKEDDSPLHTIFYESVHPDDREMVNKVYEKSLQSKLPFEIAHRIVMNDGRIKHVLESCETQYDAQGNPTLSIGTVQDITERKLMEMQLENSHDFLNQLVNSIHDPIFVKDRDHKWIILNDANIALTGFPRETLIGKSDYDIFPKDQADIFWQKDEAVFNSGKININEEYFTSADGVVHCIETIKSMFVSSNGKEYLVGTIRDITERKAMEALLEKERKFLIDAQRVAHTGSWYLDIPSGVLSWSDETYRIFELEKESIDDLHKTFYEHVHPDDREMVNAPYAESLKTKLPYQVEHRIMVGEGKIKYVIERCEHTYDDEGTPLYSIGTVQDITERKAAEKMLQSNRNLLHAILESSPDVITFALDKNYRYIAFDSKHAYVMRTIFGKEIAIGMDMFEVIGSGADRDIAKQSFDRALAGESFIAEEEYGDERLSRHYWQIYYAPIYSENDEIMGLTCFNMDISERIASEEAIKDLNETLEKRIDERTSQLRQALEFSEGVINALPDLLFEIDSNGTYLNVWARDEELLAAQKKLLLNHTLYDVLSKEAADTVMEALREADLKGVSFGNTIKIEFPQGTRYFEESVSKKSSSNTFLVLSHDITESKQIENALRESEETFRAIVENSPDVISRYDLQMRRTYVNPMMQFLLGRPLEEILGKTPREFSPLPDIDQFEQLFNAVVKGKSELEHEGVFLSPWGETRWGNKRLVPEFDADHNVIGVMVIGRDMTERIKAEKELKEREEKFHQLFKLSPAAISITSLERNIYLEVNDSFLLHTQYDRDEVIGHSRAELDLFVYPNEREELFRRIKHEGVVTNFHYSYKTKHGKVHYAAAFGSVIMFRGEKCYLGHSYDMSAVKELEQLQKERLSLEARLSKLTASVPGVNYIFEKSAQGSYRFTYLAPNFESFFGFPPEEVMGNFALFIDHIHSEDREPIRESIHHTAEHLNDWHEVFRFVHPKKGIIWIEGHSLPEKQPDDTTQWYGFFRDITKLQQR